MKNLMTKVSYVVMCFVVVLGFAGCKKSKVKSEKPTADTTTIWKENNVQNEFGEPTGEKRLDAVTLNGYFSNSATTQSPLTACFSVKWGIDKMGNKTPFVLLVLMEYNDHVVKDAGVLEISIKDKMGRIVRGKVFNEDNGAIPFDGKYYTMGSDIIYPILAMGGTVKFHLETASAPHSSYNFTINNANGLKEALNRIKK